MNLRFLSTVVAVARHGSLNAAAHSLGLSHSAVSLQIKSLEEELQFPILDRSKRPPVLTGEGLALVEHARRIEDCASDIRALADSDQIHGRATIGIVPSAVSNLMAPALASLHKAQPGLEIEVVTALSHTLIQQVHDGAVHVALVTDPGTDTSTFHVDEICEEPYQLLTGSTDSGADPYELLRTRPFIWFDRRARLSRDIDLRLREIGIDVRSSMEVNSFEAVEALVRHGLGISILPKRALSPDPDGIRYAPFVGLDAARRVVLLSRDNSPRRALVALLAQDLKALFDAA